jgi:putative copper resistance protein D
VPPVPDLLSVVCRALSFVLLLQAAGVAIFVAVFGRLLSASRAGIRAVGCWSAVAAMVFVAGHYALEAARMAGDMSGVTDPSMQMMALHSSGGAAFALRIAGLALIAFGLRGPGSAVRVAMLGAVLAIVAFALTGHTSVSSHRVAAAGILIIHLLVVAFWIGALWALYLASLREPPAVAGRIVEAFSVVAVWMVPFILLAGGGLTALLLPNLAAFSQPYGQLLLLKLGGFAVLMGLAALNKWNFGPALGRADTGAASGFRRTVVVEYILICAVLAVTAVMTTFYSPEAA